MGTIRPDPWPPADASMTIRHQHPSPPPGPFEYRFTPSVSAIRISRHVLAGWLELQPGADKVAVEDLIVVCSELVTNAVRHVEHQAPDASVAVRAAIERDGVVLEVEDAGRGFTWPTGRGFADVRSTDEQGRGLLIVEALTDDLGVSTTEHGTVVRCVKHGVFGAVPPPAPASPSGGTPPPAPTSGGLPQPHGDLVR